MIRSDSYVGPEYQPAPMQYQPAPVQYQPGPMQYQPGPMQYQPAPMQYQPGPMYYQPGPWNQPREELPEEVRADARPEAAGEKTEPPKEIEADISVLAYILGVVSPRRDLGWSPAQEGAAREKEKEKEKEEKIKKAKETLKKMSLYGALIFVFILVVVVVFVVLRKKMKKAEEEVEAEKENGQGPPGWWKYFSYLVMLLPISAVLFGDKVEKTETEEWDKPEKIIKEMKEEKEFLLNSYIKRLRRASDEEISRSVKYLSKRTHFKGVEHSKRDEMIAMLFAEEVKRGLDSC